MSTGNLCGQLMAVLNDTKQRATESAIKTSVFQAAMTQPAAILPSLLADHARHTENYDYATAAVPAGTTFACIASWRRSTPTTGSRSV